MCINIYIYICTYTCVYIYIYMYTQISGRDHLDRELRDERHDPKRTTKPARTCRAHGQSTS